MEKDFLPTLLVIDDEEDVRLLIKTIFNDTFNIIEAFDGQQGLDMAIAHVPDVIISDVMMPIMDGFEFCKQIKKNESSSHIPVLFLTAKTETEFKLQGLLLGATDYITKPFEIDELKTKVNNLIAFQQKLFKYLNAKAQGLPMVIDSAAFKQDELLMQKKENEFLQKLDEVLEKHYGNPKLDVEFLANALIKSSVQLRRKIKAITNLTVIEYIRNYRLEIAKKHLRNSDLTISEIAYNVGFESISYFSKVFQDHCTMSPSEYRDNNN
jgi:YesN/AraC family two-component response regulator